MKTEKKTIRTFRKLLRRFERLISHHLKENGCCEGVTLPQCHTLLEIEDLGETTIGRLAKRLGLDKSTVSRTVDDLVNIGLVERVRHPLDRRSTLLKLMNTGREVCKQINTVNDRYFAEVFEKIPTQNHSQLNNCIQVLVDAMRKNRTVQTEIGDLRTDK